MKLSVYLLRDTVKDFGEAFQPKYLNGPDCFTELSPTGPLPYECKAFVQTNKAKAPNWLPFLQGHFDVNQLGLLNQSNSFVLLVKVRGRFFAVTFGYGFQAINRAAIEPRFGLMVAATCLDPDEIRALESNVIDTVTRHRRTHVNVGTSVGEFDLNPSVDWIRKISGKPRTAQLAKSVSGADSVCINSNCDLVSVGAKCNELLDLFEASDTREAFRFLDYIRPLDKREPRVVQLEEELVNRLGSRSFERISIAFPDIPDEELLDHYKVSSGHRAVELEELTLEAVYNFLEQIGLIPDPSAIYVVGIGGHGEAVTKRRPLRDYLVCEIDRENDTYILCLGQWFRAQQDYVREIRAQIARLTDLTGELELIPIRNGEREDDYNERLADDKGWLVLDKKNLAVSGTHNRVEVCDVLSPEWHLVCVKKMEKSSTLSHLFAQGSVSATLLREADEYRSKVNEVSRKEWPTCEPLTTDGLGRATIVYGIATRKSGTLAATMFLISMVNLLIHVRAIQLVGCKIALCKIEYEDISAGPIHVVPDVSPAAESVAIAD